MVHVVNVGGFAHTHEIRLWKDRARDIRNHWPREMVEQLQALLDQNEFDFCWRGHRLDIGVQHPTPENEALALAAIRQLLPDGDTLEQIGTWAEKEET